MQQGEFENLIGRDLEEWQFTNIKIVYDYYPGLNIPNEMAELYKTGGDILIKDMMSRALRIKDLEEHIAKDLKALEYIKHN